MNLSGNIYYLEVTNCAGYIAYIDRVIMRKKIAKDGHEAAVAHFKVYFQRFYKGSQKYYEKPQLVSAEFRT